MTGVVSVAAGAGRARRGADELVALAPQLRAVFTDMDGTLLLPSSTLPPGAARVIDRLQATGVHFVPTSGRTLTGVRAPFGEQADRISFVAGNGMDVIVDGRCLRHLVYDRPTLVELARLVLADPEPMGMTVFDAERSYVLEREAAFLRARADSLAQAPGLPGADDLPRGPILKAAIVTVADNAPEVAERLAPTMAGRLVFAPCGAHWIDVLVGGVDKADGIQQVLDALGATPEQALGFGDSMNDEGMMRLLPHGVAVANAMEPLRALCAYEIGPNAQGSVIAVLERIAAAREALGLR